jgi:hypothetical protein
MRFLWERHRDETNGGYSWGVDGEHATVSVKQAYGGEIREEGNGQLRNLTTFAWIDKRVHMCKSLQWRLSPQRFSGAGSALA